jgi:pimeloyl-ACP methyl ester carboxylesterase
MQIVDCVEVCGVIKTRIMKKSVFDWLDRKAYPFSPHYFQVNGQQLHYIDEGKGDPIVFVHGTPSWSFDFRHLIKGLCGSHRCIAMDHIGFGLSDKPERYDYSTQHHCAVLEAFLLNKQLENITLVVHDFGGPIGMSFALNHPEKIKRIIILNSWLWSSENDPAFIRMKRILKSPLLPFLYKNLNFSPRFILPKSFGDQQIDKKVLKHYTKPFANRKQRNGALAFAHSLLNDQDWFEGLWERRYLLSDKPVTLIWGMKDPVIRPGSLEKFAAGFPHAVVCRLATCGHFPQEEEPLKVLDCIQETLSR